jgi:putative phosphoesterase
MKRELPDISIGILSDTHFRQRLFDLPERLTDIFSDTCLILHAGDVGDLQVLDLLSRIAPVAAVHGNDEPPETKCLLPDKIVIGCRGKRILLWHSHLAEPAEERKRSNDQWESKLQRIARHGREAGADIVVFGHTHVPMTTRIGDILLVNPGALASGSYFTRQSTSSVGILTMGNNGRCSVAHFDTGTGRAVDFPLPEPREAFRLLGDVYQEWLVETDLIPDVRKLRNINYKDIHSVANAIIPIYQQALDGGPILRRDLLASFQHADGMDPADRREVLAVLTGGKTNLSSGS